LEVGDLDPTDVGGHHFSLVLVQQGQGGDDREQFGVVTPMPWRVGRELDLEGRNDDGVGS
jgi:hypothetical protein